MFIILLKIFRQNKIFKILKESLSSIQSPQNGQFKLRKCLITKWKVSKKQREKAGELFSDEQLSSLVMRDQLIEGTEGNLPAKPDRPISCLNIQNRCAGPPSNAIQIIEHHH